MRKLPRQKKSTLFCAHNGEIISGAMMAFLTNSLRLFSALIIFSLFTSLAKADKLDLYEGRWRQVKSNSGDCPECSITIHRNGDTLEIISNNGWSARVKLAPKRLAIELPSVQGEGLWLSTVGGQSQKTPIWAALVHDEGQLKVFLLVGDRNLPQTIEATFQK